MPHSGTLLGGDPNDPYEITQCISRSWFSRSRRTIAHFVAAPLGARSAIEFTRERDDVRSAGYRQLQMMGFPESNGGRSRARTADLLLVSLSVYPYIADSFSALFLPMWPICVPTVLIEQHSEQQFSAVASITTPSFRRPILHGQRF